MSSKQSMAREETQEVHTQELPPPSYQDVHHDQRPTSSNAPHPTERPQAAAHPVNSSSSIPFVSSPQVHHDQVSPAGSHSAIQHYYTVAQTPGQQFDSTPSQRSEMKMASDFYPAGSADELKRQTSANAYSPAGSMSASRRDSYFNLQNPADAYGYNNSSNAMSTISEQNQRPGSQMPVPSSPITMLEPKPTMPMVADTKNLLQKSKFPNGERDWSYGMCDCCCENMGTWCFACWCPCIVYSKLKSRVSFLERNNYPHPGGGSGCSSDCFMHCCLTSVFGVGWVLQIGQRSTIRDRYRIAGSGCGDCMTAWCCTPCTLTQESREIALEERALGGLQTLRLD